MVSPIIECKSVVFPDPIEPITTKRPSFFISKLIFDMTAIESLSLVEI